MKKLDPIDLAIYVSMTFVIIGTVILVTVIGIAAYQVYPYLNPVDLATRTAFVAVVLAIIFSVVKR